MEKKKAVKTEVRERDEQRFYTLPSGEEVPSVTTILSVIDKSGPLVGWAVRETCDYIEKALCEKWGELEVGHGLHETDVKETIEKARKEATRIKTEAADIGTLLHDAVEDWAKTIISGKPFFAHFEEERLAKAWEAFLAFADKYAIVPLASETKAVNEEKRYGGTVDLIASITPPEEEKPTTYLLDIKSSNYFLEIPYGPQVAAYAGCKLLHPLDGIGVLRLDKKTGEPHFHDLTKNQADYLRVFDEAHGLWLALQEFKKSRRKTK